MGAGLGVGRSVWACMSRGSSAVSWTGGRRQQALFQPAYAAHRSDTPVHCAATPATKQGGGRAWVPLASTAAAMHCDSSRPANGVDITLFCST